MKTYKKADGMRNDVSRRSFVQSIGFGASAAAIMSYDGPRSWARAMSLALPEQERPLLLHNNENPLGPGTRVIAAMNDALEGGPKAGRYPGGAITELVESIAMMNNVPVDYVMVGNGSTQLLRSATQVFTSPSKHLVTASPSYEEARDYAGLNGHPVEELPLKEMSLDLDAMADAARGAGLVFVNNPNNPTATLHSGEAIGTLIDRVLSETDAMIMVDEAYHDYVTDKNYETQIPRAIKEQRVIVARTFSKAHGMAGMRIGWCVAHPDAIARMREWHYGLSLNIPSLLGARTSIEDPDRISREAERNTAARQFTIDWFASRGIATTDSQANFIFARTGIPAGDFRAANQQRGILVGRDFPPYEREWSRISISTMDDMRRAVNVFDSVLPVATEQSNGRRSDAAA
ncbi:MAG: aminotransferase class I/II-fold pyridoxal phosphate-dependent enzyme [Gemmatimonadetes bacterium]|nr:aminotransferase class I/II-fold pyridoxal phosphate-dependent enzyme [Gemmatimonadota bacterium]